MNPITEMRLTAPLRLPQELEATTSLLNSHYMVSDSLLQTAKRLLREKIDGAIYEVRRRREAVRWNRSGRPIPPPNCMKAETLKEYGRRFHLRTLVETGTYIGEMIYATHANFNRVISIEIDAGFYERARERFRYTSHVQLLFGDSGEILGPLVARLEEPCLFWLDAHHDEDDTPIDRELTAIVEHARRYRDVIVIDDARSYKGRNGYPTPEQLASWFGQELPAYDFRIEHDIMRATPVPM